MSALTLAGIGNPTRNRLVALLGITPELVTAEAERARARGAGPGALVENIRAAVQRRAIERARADAEERQRQEKKRAEAEAHERIEAGRRETAALIDRLSDAELAKLKSQALARASGFQRERWQNADPRTCYTLQVRMRAIHKAAVEGQPQ